jgi:hypothetical protein
MSDSGETNSKSGDVSASARMDGWASLKSKSKSSTRAGHSCLHFLAARLARNQSSCRGLSGAYLVS